MEIFINPYTGQKATTKKGIKRFISPPWLKGEWVRTDNSYKKVKHIHTIMRRLKE